MKRTIELIEVLKKSKRIVSANDDQVVFTEELKRLALQSSNLKSVQLNFILGLDIYYF